MSLRRKAEIVNPKLSFSKILTCPGNEFLLVTLEDSFLKSTDPIKIFPQWKIMLKMIGS